MKDQKLNMEKLFQLIKRKPVIDHEIMIDSEGVFWTTDGNGCFWFWDGLDEIWVGDKLPRNDLVTVKYLDCLLKPRQTDDPERFNFKCSGLDFGTQFDKKFAATYSEAVQIGENEYKQVRTTKVFSYRDSFLKVIEWLESIGVKGPNINSVDISEVTE